MRTERPLNLALVGTRGVPARYGGFETCVEEVGTRLARRGHDVVVYCRRSEDVEPRPSYAGIRLVHLGAMRRRSLETLSHTALSTAHLLRHRVDAAIVFNAANAPFVPILQARGIPVATHVDGLEWRRSKWGAAGRRYYRRAEQWAVRWSDALIADAPGIADYYRDEFATPTELIAYGAPLHDVVGTSRVDEVDLEPGEYHLVVARFEPENHVLEIVDGYRRSTARRPLVVVGSAPYADEYTAQVHAAAASDDRIRFLGGVWDQGLLDDLYAGAFTYLHGHSVGGTNPSLLRAIGAGAATTAWDVSFNRDVLGDAGRWFDDAASVTREVEHSELDEQVTTERSRAARSRASTYDWDDVTDRYEHLLRRLGSGELRRGRGRGRRRGAYPAPEGR